MLNTAALLGFSGIVLLVATTTIWFSRARRVAIPDNRLAFLLGWAGPGLFGAAAFASPGLNVLGGVFGAFSIVGSLFFLGLYALRKQRAGNPISVGATVPAFEAVDDQGSMYKSEYMIGTPTLLKFFRGHW
jgi:hypothetical protein